MDLMDLGVQFGHVWRTIDCLPEVGKTRREESRSPASGRTQGEQQQAGHRGRNSLAGPSRCQQTFKKRSATGKSRRVAQQAKKLKTVEEDEVMEKAQTKQEYHAQRAIGHLEDAEQRKRDRRKIFAKTSSKREVIASKAPTTTKRQRARAEFVSSRLSRQAKRIT
ncbi:hypothetical protein MRX96_033408 [Rhipicephalus microplus]